MQLNFTIEVPIHRSGVLSVDESEILSVKSHSFMAYQNGGMGTVQGVLLTLFNGDQYNAFDSFEDVSNQLDGVEFIQGLTLDRSKIAFQRTGVSEHGESDDYLPGLKHTHIFIVLVNGRRYQISGNYQEFLAFFNA